MRDDSLDLINNHLFEPAEQRALLPPSSQKLLEQVQDLYTVQLNDPFMSRKQARQYLVNKYKITVSQAYNIMALTAQALGNVQTSAKNWIKTKCDALMEEAYNAAKSRDFELAKILTKQALVYAKIYRLDVDEGELLDAKKYLTIEQVQITMNPEDIGIKMSEKDKAMAEKYMKKFTEEADFEEVKDEESISS